MILYYMMKTSCFQGNFQIYPECFAPCIKSSARGKLAMDRYGNSVHKTMTMDKNKRVKSVKSIAGVMRKRQMERKMKYKSEN